MDDTLPTTKSAIDTITSRIGAVLERLATIELEVQS